MKPSDRRPDDVRHRATTERCLTRLGFVAVVLLAACGGSGPSRADVIASLTEEAVPARYAAMADEAAAVVPAVQGWCDGDGSDEVVSTIAAARSSWVELRPFSFGPANERRSMFVIDPTIREEDVDALAIEGTDVDAESLREFAGADQRGWHAVEHLVQDEPTDRSCEYALGAAQLTADEFAAIAAEWPSYGATVAADDEAANVALRNIVSESLFSVQMVIDEPEPATDSARLSGIRTAIVGDEETPGITELLSDDLVERLAAELDAGDAEAVQITISTEVVGELGTTVNFSDADGDG